MVKLNSTLRQEASEALAGKWASAAGVTLICILISGVINYIMQDHDLTAVGMLLYLLVIPNCLWGYNIIFLDVYRGGRPKLDTLFSGFKDYGRITGTSLLTMFYTLLWMLLLIVPGIIKALSYAMTPYILRDYPELSYNAAIEKSMAMMEGYKMKLFLLYLSFIGWYLLCLLTLGIGFLFLYPYCSTSVVAFYENLKAETTAKEEATLA